MAVGGGINAIGGAEVGMGIAHGTAQRRLAAIVEVGGDDLKLQVENGLQQAHFVPPSPTGDTPADETGEDALDEVGAGGQVGDGESHRDRGFAMVAAEPGET